jgi:hypothetical protein
VTRDVGRERTGKEVGGHDEKVFKAAGRKTKREDSLDDGKAFGERGRGRGS